MIDMSIVSKCFITEQFPTGLHIHVHGFVHVFSQLNCLGILLQSMGLIGTGYIKYYSKQIKYSVFVIKKKFNFTQIKHISNVYMHILLYNCLSHEGGFILPTPSSAACAATRCAGSQH